MSKIYLIRSVKVMLDRDLAELYNVETSQLKRQVRRNIGRFPDDFMFELTKEELEDPEEISGGRVERIAKGSGRQVSEVRELLKQYRQSKKMMKMLKGGDERKMQKMMQKMQSGQMKLK